MPSQNHVSWETYETLDHHQLQLEVFLNQCQQELSSRPELNDDAEEEQAQAPPGALWRLLIGHIQQEGGSGKQRYVMTLLLPHSHADGLSVTLLIKGLFDKLHESFNGEEVS